MVKTTHFPPIFSWALLRRGAKPRRSRRHDFNIIKPPPADCGEKPGTAAIGKDGMIGGCHRALAEGAAAREWILTVRRTYPPAPSLKGRGATVKFKHHPTVGDPHYPAIGKMRFFQLRRQAPHAFRRRLKLLFSAMIRVAQAQNGVGLVV